MPSAADRSRNYWSGRADLNLRRLAGVNEASVANRSGSLLPKSRAQRGIAELLVGTGRFELEAFSRRERGERSEPKRELAAEIPSAARDRGIIGRDGQI